MQEESHNLGNKFENEEPRVRGCFSHSFPLLVENSWRTVRGETEDLDSLFSSGLAFFPRAFKPTIWRISPMDEGKIELCGRMASQTQIDKAFQVDNVLLSWDERVHV